jgi:hypothetical protein
MLKAMLLELQKETRRYANEFGDLANEIDGIMRDYDTSTEQEITARLIEFNINMEKIKL